MTERTLPAVRLVRQTPSWCGECDGRGWIWRIDDDGAEYQRRCGCDDGVAWVTVGFADAPRPALDAEGMSRIFHDARMAQFRRDGRIAWDGSHVAWDDLDPEQWQVDRLYRDGVIEAMTAVAAAIAPPDAREIAGELRAPADDVAYLSSWMPPEDRE